MRPFSASDEELFAIIARDELTSLKEAKSSPDYTKILS